MSEPTLLLAFTAGIVSFASPCVLPLIPGFLSYLAGSAGAGNVPRRSEVVLNALFFVLGFSLVFAALGILLETILSSVAYSAQVWLARFGGAIVIFFGLHLTGLLHIPFLDRAHTVAVRPRKRSRYITSFLFGLAFAAGWTPCVSAALGVILGLAAAEPGIAFPLLITYALGLGLPFLVISMFVAEATVAIQRYGRLLPYLNAIFGAFLIILGMLIFTQELNRIANFPLLNRLLLP